MSACSPPDYEDFYRYDSGRWLWYEEEQLRKRYRRFNVAELKKVAAKCSEAETCVSMIKLAEDLQKLTLGMLQALTILEIPVPKVLSWCGKTDNLVESEYILMEEATGTQLALVWDEMELESKLKIVEDIVSVERKLLSLSFTWFALP
ncbi:MAG: hypothetical protein LQ351_000108 [Letrouitia transgressa]|nr:MAG: hypothetical protein LQ351_000108 [Letrouitia transgressa]